MHLAPEIPKILFGRPSGTGLAWSEPKVVVVVVVVVNGSVVISRPWSQDSSALEFILSRSWSRDLKAMFFFSRGGIFCALTVLVWDQKFCQSLCMLSATRT